VTLQVALEVDTPVVECGTPLTGTVRWSGNRRGTVVGVVLRYRTEGRGDTDSGVAVQCLAGDAESGATRFRLDVPAGGPVTYHGHLVRLLWQVAVVSPLRRTAGRPGTGAAIADVTVIPHGWARRAVPRWGSPG